MKTNFPRIIALAATFFLSAVAVADMLIVDGGEPDQVSAFLADSNHELTIAATRFTLTETSTFDRLLWWGIYYPNGAAPAADGFTLTLYADNAGVPGSTLVSVGLGNVQREATGNTVVAWNEYAYAANFSLTTLNAGDYFIGLGNAHIGSDLWGWETTSGGLQAGGASYHAPSGTWQVDASENLAFGLYLPEPDSLALFGIGAVVLVCGQFLRKSRKLAR